MLTQCHFLRERLSSSCPVTPQERSLGHYRLSIDQLSAFHSVLCSSHCLAEFQCSPLWDVIFPSLLLSPSCPVSSYGAVEDGLCFAMIDDPVIWPYHLSALFLTVARWSLCGPTAWLIGLPGCRKFPGVFCSTSSPSFVFVSVILPWGSMFHTHREKLRWQLSAIISHPPLNSPRRHRSNVVRRHFVCRVLLLESEFTQMRK